MICQSRTREEWLHQPCWRVTLSDGSTVYSLENKSSWLDLKEWLYEHPNIYISSLQLQFRDNIIEVFTGRRDYILFHTVDCWYGSPESQRNYFVGYREGDNAVLNKYKSPELVFVKTEYRSLEDTSVKQGIIYSENNHTCQQTENSTEQEILPE